MLEDINVGGGNSPSTGPVPGAPEGSPAPAPKTGKVAKQEPISGDEMLSSVQSYDIEQGKIALKQINDVTNGEPYLYPPEEVTLSSEEVNKQSGNSYFQNVALLNFLFAMIEAARMKSHFALTEAEIELAALDAEWDLGQFGKTTVRNAAKKEYKMHMALAVTAGIAAGATTVGALHGGYVKGKATKEYNNKYGPGGTVEQERNNLLGRADDQQRQNFVAQMGDRAPQNLPPAQPPGQGLNQEDQNKLRQLNQELAHNKTEKGQADWVRAKERNLINDSLIGRYEMMFHPETINQYRRLLDNLIEGRFKLEKSQLDALQHVIEAGKKMNQRLLDGSIEERRKLEGEVSEMLRTLDQILGEMYRTFGAFSVHKA